MFLGPFLKNWWFLTFKWIKIFEWNFQQIFLIKFCEQPIQIGWAWPHLMPAPPVFQQYYFFKNDPKNLTKVENFKKNCILGNHFIGVLYGILHFLILLVYPEKLMENLLLLNTFCTPLYMHTYAHLYARFAK